jgi:hypothetical protein
MPADKDSLFITLYTDADVHGELAAKVRERGFEAWSAYEKKRAGLTDDEQLEYAAEQSGTLLTHNIKHFEPLYRQWHAAGTHHAGIVVSQRLGVGELLRRVLRLLNRVAADEMRDNLKNLAEFAERRTQR